MAQWEIDSFKVRPTVFSAWSLPIILFVTDAGVVTAQPSTPVCISDFVNNDRRYKVGDLITTFCNLATHTRYKVFAANCYPYATVTTEANSTLCGYAVPIPTPSVPPNPYVTPETPAPEYGLYKTLDFCNVDYEEISVKIYKKAFSGSPTEIQEGGRNPVILRYKCDDDNKFSPIRSLELSLSFICNENFNLSELYTADERQFKVIVSRETSIVFIGWIVPDSCNEPFSAPPYDVTIRATDGIRALKKVTYPLPSGSKISLRQKLIGVLSYCFNLTNLDLDIHTICNLYESKMANGLNDDPLSQSACNPLRFVHDNGFVYNIYEVLEALCTVFGAHIVQINGAWHFIRTSELSATYIRKRVYQYTGFFLRGEYVSPVRLAGLNEDVIVLEGGEISIRNAYKRVEVNMDLGKMPSIIYNGDFSIWDGSNFSYWTKFGGIQVGRQQNTVRGNGGVNIGVDDYSLLFLQKYNEAKYLQADPIDVEKGDKLKLSFNVGNTVSVTARFKMRLFLGEYTIGNFIIDNKLASDVFTWSQSLTTMSIDINNLGGRIDDYKVDITLPEAPISGQIFIQLFGFSQLERVREVDHAVGLNFINYKLVESTVYTPVPIDNFGLAKSNDKDSKVTTTNPDSFYFVSSQMGFYSETPDKIETILGDYQELNSGRPRLDPTAATVRNLYAIYTSDNSYSKTWYEYGIGGTPAPINLMLAKTILKNYQRPSRLYQGEFKGSGMHYLNILNIIVPGSTEFSEKLFTFLSVDFDLKYNTANGNLAEIFTKSLYSEESVSIVPQDNGGKIKINHGSLIMGVGAPPYQQNPYQIFPDESEGGIFTDEFTTEFT